MSNMFWIFPYNESEGFPRTGYFIPGHVGGWGLARLGRPSAGVFPALAWPGQARPF